MIFNSRCLIFIIGIELRRKSDGTGPDYGEIRRVLQLSMLLEMGTSDMATSARGYHSILVDMAKSPRD